MQFLLIGTKLSRSTLSEVAPCLSLRALDVSCFIYLTIYEPQHNDIISASSSLIVIWNAQFTTIDDKTTSLQFLRISFAARNSIFQS